MEWPAPEKQKLNKNLLHKFLFNLLDLGRRVAGGALKYAPMDQRVRPYRDFFRQQE